MAPIHIFKYEIDGPAVACQRFADFSEVLENYKRLRFFEIDFTYPHGGELGRQFFVPRVNFSTGESELRHQEKHRKRNCGNVKRADWQSSH